MLNFDRSTVKRGTQNSQNNCHQWLSGSLMQHQIRFRPGLRPDPTGGTYSAPLDLLAGLRGFASKRQGGEIWKGRGREREGPPTALSQIPGSAPGNGLYSLPGNYLPLSQGVFTP